MKMRHIHRTYLLAAAALLASCNDFLDEMPDNRTTIDSPEAVSELLVSAYPEGNCVFFTESMSDNVTDRGATLDSYVQSEWNRANQQAFFWKDIDMSYQDSPSWFWNSCYEAIAAANHALEAIGELESAGTDCTAQKGEALVARAYCHFMLLNLFAQHYDPATASSDLGIAYVTKPETEVFGHYERLSVAESYRHVREDLEAGMDLIQDKSYGSTPKYHFTRAAAYAFACRFYLYIGEWEKAVDCADKVLGSSPTLRNWNEYSKLTSVVRQKRYTSVEENANLLLCSTISLFAEDQSFYRYGYSMEINNKLFQQNDNLVGLTWAYRAETYQVSSEALTFLKWQPYTLTEGVNATTGVKYVMVPLFTTDEVICNRIEALGMLKRYDDACRDIETFLTNKMTGYDASVQPVSPGLVIAFYKTWEPLHPYYQATMDEEQMAFAQCATDFRRREQLMEGGRWFDIKRHGIEVAHKVYQTEAEDVLARRDPRRAIQIPEDAISYGITPNPR